MSEAGPSIPLQTRAQCAQGLRTAACVAARTDAAEARELLLLADQAEAEPLDVLALARTGCALVARVAALVCATAFACEVLDRVTRDPRELVWTSPAGHEHRTQPREGETWRFTSAGPVRVEGPR